MRSISIGEAAIVLGVSVGTLRRWEREGRLSPAFRTLGNHRRYDLATVFELAGRPVAAKSGKTVCYARLSSHDQKRDLETQGERLLAHCEAEGIADPLLIKDLGSGLNYRKRGLKRLLSMLMSGQVSRLVIAYKDRLLRFGSELIFSLCEHLRVEVTVLESKEGGSLEASLCADVIELMTVFSARLHGMRSHRNRKKAA
ncbi:MAG: IS607 family transposase [Verrucomicrobiota bacterium]